MTFVVESILQAHSFGVLEAGVLEHGGFRYVFFCKKAGILALARACEDGCVDDSVRSRIEMLIQGSSLPNSGQDIDPNPGLAQHLDNLFSRRGTLM